jgi:hypothetical protein
MKQQQKALKLLNALLLLVLTESGQNSQEGYQLQIDAAKAYGKAFDIENAKGLCFGEHDKWLAMSRICWSGVSHAYTREEAAKFIAEYIVQVEEWLNLR